MSEVGGQIVRYLKMSQYRQRLEIRDLYWCIPKSGATATLLCDEIHTGTFWWFKSCDLMEQASAGRRLHVMFARGDIKQSSFAFALLSGPFWSCAVSSWSWSELVFVSPCSQALFDITEH